MVLLRLQSWDLASMLGLANMSETWDLGLETPCELALVSMHIKDKTQVYFVSHTIGEGRQWQWSGMLRAFNSCPTFTFNNQILMVLLRLQSWDLTSMLGLANVNETWDLGLGTPCEPALVSMHI